jgi:hypothetical protein
MPGKSVGSDLKFEIGLSVPALDGDDENSEQVISPSLGKTSI